MKKTKLKGGSLAATYLIEENGAKFVRKEVSLTENREYGFQRWYSQMKRMQRYSVMFPGFFPSVIKIGQDKNNAYFDMDYVPDAITGHEFLITTTDARDVFDFTDRLLLTMKSMHTHRVKSSPEAIELYFNEEIVQRLRDCAKSSRFDKFARYDTISFNGEEIPSFMSQFEDYKELLLSYYSETTETFTHGNITLENILYNQQINEITLIDPYEENIIDNELCEFSQLFQSSNAKYEIYNTASPEITDNEIVCPIPQYAGLNQFNSLLTSYIIEKRSLKDLTTIKLLEVSQFIRMLPFKMALDEDKMLLFYALASKLLFDLRKNL
jgi:hypothetical protein